MSIIADAKLKCAINESFNLRSKAVKDILEDIINIFKTAYYVDETRKAGKRVISIESGMDGFEYPTYPTIIIDDSSKNVYITVRVNVPMKKDDITRRLDILIDYNEPKVILDFKNGEIAKHEVTHITFLRDLLESAIDVIFKEVMEDVK